MKSKRLAPLMCLAILMCFLIMTGQAIAARKIVQLDEQPRTLNFSKAVPNQLNYQGFLADAADSTAVTDVLGITFRLFDSETKGAELWSETHPSVPISYGLFQVQLGSVTSFPPGLFDGTAMWLQTEVGAEVFAPRKPLASVAYSHRSNSAEKLLDLTLMDLDDRWVNEEDLDHLDAADGDPANAVYVDVAGKVGIGTTTPARNLHIHEDKDGVVGIDIENPSTGSSSIEMITFTDENGGVAGIATYDDGSSYPSAMRIYNNRLNGTIGLVAKSFERVRISNDGKVGIGTTTPAKELDVNGEVIAHTYWGDGSNLTGIAGTADADWTIAGNDMYSAVPGNVGIGTANPTSPLTIQAIVGTDIEFLSSGSNADITTAAQMNVGTTSGSFLNLLTNGFYRLSINGSGDVGIGTATPSTRLDVEGNVQADSIFLGSSSKAGQNGGLLLYNDGFTTPIVELGAHHTAGGKATLRDTSGNWHNRLEPDIDGSGGFLAVYRNAFSEGFMVNGNNVGTEEPWVWINGSARSAEFFMGNPGDASVLLPTGAISAGEIMDEPGVSNNLGQSFFWLGAGNTDYTVDSLEINIPAPGYVEVTAGCYLNLFHTNGTHTGVYVAIDKTAGSVDHTYPGAQIAWVPDPAPTAGWSFPCTSTRLYQEISAGTKRYYLNAKYASGTDPSTNVARSYLRATYYPTLYGSLTLAETDGTGDVSTTTPQGSGDGTESALEPRRRTITVDDHNARLEAEMAALRTELDALKEEVQNQRRH